MFKALLRLIWPSYKKNNPSPEFITIPVANSWDGADGGNHGFIQTEAVSRHAIAETGLTCPRCSSIVCPRGDYSLVRRTVMPSGEINEVVKCIHKRQINDEEMVCNTYLLASPDTEHGDNLIFDSVPKQERAAKFYSFVRISRRQAIKDEHGHDVEENKDGSLSAVGQSPQQKAERKKFVYTPGEVYTMNDGRSCIILRVQNIGDPMFDGWAKVQIHLEPDGWEWDLDPYGVIRRTLRDPTLDDKLTITFIQRPV